VSNFAIRWRPLLALLREAWPTWLAIGGLALAATIGYITSSTPGDGVRFGGTILQIMGLFTVALGLWKTRQLFGRPSLVASLKGYLKRLGRVFQQPKPVTGSGSITLPAFDIRGEGRFRHGLPAGASLDQRVDALEKNLDLLERKFDSKTQNVNKRFAELDERVQRETKERSAADEKVMTQIEEVAVGGLHLESVGLVWLIFGVLGASVPDVIAALLAMFAP
jgi:hypothetical protein